MGPSSSRSLSSGGFLRGVVLLLGLCAVSSGAILIRLAQVPPLTAAAYRVGLASLVALPVGLSLGRRELAHLQARDWRDLALAGFFLAVHFATWIASLQWTPVARSVLFCSTAPLWTALLAPWLTGDGLNRQEKQGLLLGLAGAATVGLGDLSGGSGALVGDGLASMGALAFGLYLLMGRRVRRQLSLAPYVGLCYSFGALWLFAMAWWSGAPLWGFRPPVWGLLWATALIPQLLGHSAYNWALRGTNAVMVSVTVLGEPLLAGLLAWQFFGERPATALLLGGGLLLAGILRASWKGEETGS